MAKEISVEREWNEARLQIMTVGTISTDVDRLFTNFMTTQSQEDRLRIFLAIKGNLQALINAMTKTGRFQGYGLVEKYWEIEKIKLSLKGIKRLKEINLELAGACASKNLFGYDVMKISEDRVMSASME